MHKLVDFLFRHRLVVRVAPAWNESKFYAEPGEVRVYDTNFKAVVYLESRLERVGFTLNSEAVDALLVQQPGFTASTAPSVLTAAERLAGLVSTGEELTARDFFKQAESETASVAHPYLNALIQHFGDRRWTDVPMPDREELDWDGSEAIPGLRAIAPMTVTDNQFFTVLADIWVELLGQDEAWSDSDRADVSQLYAVNAAFTRSGREGRIFDPASLMPLDFSSSLNLGWFKETFGELDQASEVIR